MTSNILILNDEYLNMLSSFIKTPLFLFNANEVILLNDVAQKLPFDEKILKSIFGDTRSKTSHTHDLEVKTQYGDTFSVTGQDVIYKDTFYLLGKLECKKEYSRDTFQARHISYAMNLMVEISEKLANINAEDDIYAFILENARKAVRKSKYCTIMIFENGKTKVVAKSGFNDKVYDVCIDLEKTFPYVATKGMMDRIVNIPNLLEYLDCYYDNGCIDEAPRLLKSVLSAPIYVDGKLFGLINFDCVEINGFDQDDVDLLNLVRENLEVALSIHFNLKKLDYYANYDQLTGLRNRIYLENSFDSIVSKLDPAFVVMIDLNDLKKVNDTCGHIYGDRFIKKFASEFKAGQLKGELFARNGGDEFVGILTGTDIDSVIKRIEDIQNRLNSDPIETDDEEIIVSFSYGVVEYHKGTKMFDALREADILMYNFKRNYKKKKNKR